MAISSSKKARAGEVRARRRVKMASLRRWVRRARGKGMTGRELVFELHERRGLALRKVAKVLRLGLGVVQEHWWQSCAARAALAPKPERVFPLLAVRTGANPLRLAPRSEADFGAMRERVSLALWETVVATYAEVTPPKAEGGNEGGDGAAPLPTVLPMLSVRLKALKQMGKLHGLGCKSRASATAFDPPPYATPEEIAEMVRERRRGSGV